MTKQSHTPGAGRWTAGTLTYTSAGIGILFFWLLWGDFAWSMKDRAVTSVATLMVKSFGVSDFMFGLLILSFPNFTNAVLGPLVSYFSDRHRGRFGRRIPFLAFTVPFIVTGMLGLAFTPLLGEMLHNAAEADTLSRHTASLIVFGVFWIMFDFGNTLASSIFTALVNDVVPTSLLGRFFGLFRGISLAAGVIFNYFLLGRAESHSMWIFLGLALLYAFGFTLLLFKVKEGEYPPPPPVKPGLKAMVAGYFRDCFSVPFFSILFVGLAFNYVSTVCRNMFNLLFALNDLGLTTAQFGRVGAVGGIVGVALYLPMGYLVDRFHPLRIYLAGALLVIFVNPFGFFFVHGYGTFMAMGILLAVVYTVQNSSLLPLCVKLYPKEQFGQFCSAAAMVKALLLVAANAAGGWFIDLFGYRWLYVWDFLFTIPCFVLLLWIYFRWKKLGGDEGYQPPLRP